MGRVRRQPRQLLVPQHAARSRSRPTRRRCPTATTARDPATSVGTGNPTNESELIRCVVAFETRNFDPGGPCPWIAHAARAGRRRAARRASAPASRRRLRPRRRRRRPAPRSDPVPLGQATCTRLERARPRPAAPRCVERLRGFAGGVVNTGEQDIGTGAVLSDAEAATACSTRWCGAGVRARASCSTSCTRTPPRSPGRARVAEAAITG